MRTIAGLAVAVVLLVAPAHAAYAASDQAAPPVHRDMTTTEPVAVGMALLALGLAVRSRVVQP